MNMFAKQNKESEIKLREVPKGTKTWATVQLSKVQMFFPQLHHIETNTKFPATKFSALFVIGNQGDAAYDAIAPLVVEMAQKWFVKDGKPCTIADMGKNTFVKFEEGKEGKNIAYVGQHFIQPKRDPKHGVVPVVDAKVRVLSSDEVALINSGALVNARVSFGPFQVSSDVFGIMGSLDAVQVIKNGNLGGVAREDNVSQFFVPEDGGFGYVQEEEIPF
jgi:Protein of unknown function (DUF2815)